MFPLWKERELRTVSTTDDDEGGPIRCKKPNLDCIIGASLADDLGANSAVFERIIRFFRSRSHCCVDDSPMGFVQNIRAVQMARQKTKPGVRVPALSSNG